jgi:hypothetical protein
VHVKVFESGGAVLSPPEPPPGKLVQWTPQHRNVAIAEDAQLIGHAGQIAIEGHILWGAGPQRRR